MENLQFVEEFIKKLKKKDYKSTTQITKDCADLFRIIIKEDKWKDFDVLISSITKIGIKFISADPLQFSIGNIVKRV